jgi:prepilin-type N-terminal cleavage/methylation domain-containing protein
MAALPVARRKGERGFTLIEVMIAMVLTAIAIMGIIALYVTETKASGFSRHSTEASVLAQDRLEMMRTGTSATIALTSEPNLNEQGLTVAGALYTRTYQQTFQTTYADMVVTVSWSDDGQLHVVTINGRRGP